MEWREYKEDIIAHHAVWSGFSKQVINKEMTAFQNLTQDGTVQLTKYGDHIRVIANFSDDVFLFEKLEIEPHSLIIDRDGDIQIYSPNSSIMHK